MVRSHPIASRFDCVLDNLADNLFESAGEVLDACDFANSGLYRLVTASGLIFPCVAGTFDARNACAVLGDASSAPLMVPSVALGRIVPGSCPLHACRHYRCSLVINSFLKLGDSAVEEYVAAGAGREPSLI